MFIVLGELVKMMEKGKREAGRDGTLRRGVWQGLCKERSAEGDEEAIG